MDAGKFFLDPELTGIYIQQKLAEIIRNERAPHTSGRNGLVPQDVARAFFYLGARRCRDAQKCGSFSRNDLAKSLSLVHRAAEAGDFVAEFFLGVHFLERISPVFPLAQRMLEMVNAASSEEAKSVRPFIQEDGKTANETKEARKIALRALASLTPMENKKGVTTPRLGPSRSESPAIKFRRAQECFELNDPENRARGFRGLEECLFEGLIEAGLYLALHYLTLAKDKSVLASEMIDVYEKETATGQQLLALLRNMRPATEITGKTPSSSAPLMLPEPK